MDLLKASNRKKTTLTWIITRALNTYQLFPRAFKTCRFYFDRTHYRFYMRQSEQSGLEESGQAKAQLEKYSD